MRKMFTINSGLDKIVEGQQLVVSDVLQKAVIDVNENGTEAAAVTGECDFSIKLSNLQKLK